MNSKNKKVVVFVASCAAVNFYHGVFSSVNANEGTLQINLSCVYFLTLSPELLIKERTEKGDEAEKKEEGVPHVQLIDAPILKLHGELSQVDRTNATAKFRKYVYLSLFH